MRAALSTKKQMSISALLKGELLRSLRPISANVQMSSWQLHTLTNSTEVREKDKEKKNCVVQSLAPGP